MVVVDAVVDVVAIDELVVWTGAVVVVEDTRLLDGCTSSLPVSSLFEHAARVTTAAQKTSHFGQALPVTSNCLVIAYGVLENTVAIPVK